MIDPAATRPNATNSPNHSDARGNTLYNSVPIIQLLPHSGLIVSYCVGLTLVSGWAFLHQILQLAGKKFLGIESDLLALSLEYISYGILSIQFNIFAFIFQIILLSVAVAVLIGLSHFPRWRLAGVFKVAAVMALAIATVSAFPKAIDAGKDYACDQFKIKLDENRTNFPKIWLEFKDLPEPKSFESLSKECLWRIFMDKKHIYFFEGFQNNPQATKVHMVKIDALSWVAISHDEKDRILCTITQGN